MCYPCLDTGVTYVPTLYSEAKKVLGCRASPDLHTQRIRVRQLNIKIIENGAFHSAQYPDILDALYLQSLQRFTKKAEIPKFNSSAFLVLIAALASDYQQRKRHFKQQKPNCRLQHKNFSYAIKPE